MKRLWKILFAALVLLSQHVAANAQDLFPEAQRLYHPEQYSRPHGPQAPWNIPVKSLPRHRNSAVYAKRLWDNAREGFPGQFDLTFEKYTYPVYHAKDASGVYPVKTTWDTNINGTLMPWNPNWAPAGGADAQIILLDRASGREWNLWQARFENGTVKATNGNLVDGDFREKEDGFYPSRGCGIQYLAMLVRPEEIMLGEIRHALSMPIRNTDGNVFVAPATKLEHPENPPGVPEGMRFALDISDAEIEQWIASLPGGLKPETLMSARIIARALRDYGWFITDTSGGAHIQFESTVTAGEKWEAVGLGKQHTGGRSFPLTLLDGLMKQDRIYTVVPSDEYPEQSAGAKDACLYIDEERGKQWRPAQSPRRAAFITAGALSFPPLLQFVR